MIPNSDRRNELKGELFRETLESSGQARLAVTGTSMLPSIWPGDVVEVRRESVAEISPGDVVLCARHGGFLAHRVVYRGAGVSPMQHGQDAHATVLITRGDALREPDRPVTPDELLGRVTAILRGGRRIEPRLTRWGRAASWVFSRSDLCTALVLHCRRILSPRQNSQELATEVSPHPSRSGR